MQHIRGNTDNRHQHGMTEGATTGDEQRDSRPRVPIREIRDKGQK